MNDVFKHLQSGARFNSGRFKDTMHLFKTGRSRGTTTAADGSDGPAASMDFFGNDAALSTAADESKTADKQQAEAPHADANESYDDDESQEDGEDDDGDDDDDDDDDVDAVAAAAATDEDDDEEADDSVKMFSKSTAVKPGTTNKALKAQRIQEQQIASFRKHMKIRVAGTAVPDPVPKFEQITTHPRVLKALLHNLDQSAFKEPTPIQMQSIPVLLSKRDLLAVAPTGSGKTAAYLLPIIAQLERHSKDGIRALIVCPTRELGQQIVRDIAWLCEDVGLRSALLSKSNIAGAQGLPAVDILVTTPLRLDQLAQDEEIKKKLDSVQILIMDEADKLFEMGFVEQVDTILAACRNPALVRGMFSATMPTGIEDMIRSVLRDHIRVTVGVLGAGAETVEQQLLFVGREEGKLLAIRQLAREGMKPPVLIFLQSIERAKELYQELRFDGLNVDVIHAERSKAQRDAAVKAFRSGQTWILIATDLMARGIDFKGVNLVINFDLPQTIVSYVHRIGRTGRAGRLGKAVTFFTEADIPRMRSFANVMKLSGAAVPDWLLTIPQLSRSERKHLARSAPSRYRISTVSRFDRVRAAKKRNAISATRRKHDEPADAAGGDADAPKPQSTKRKPREAAGHSGARAPPAKHKRTE